MRRFLPLVLISATVILSSSSTLSAMDRWDALAMIESGDNDHAIGPRGEVSRYQILPALWPGGNPLNEQEALSAARAIMNERLQRFERLHNRAANDFEFYVLWNAPWEVDHPSKIVSERARRFANLAEASDLAKR
jgi:hypothetical protein